MVVNTVFVGVFASAMGLSSVLPSAPAGDPMGDDISSPPATYKANGVTVNERLGARVPLDAVFRTTEGRLVTLGQVVAPAGNTMPTIVTFNYSSCPMLCNLQLHGLQAALPKIAETTQGMQFRVGAQFRIVTIDLEPAESPARAAKMREKYLAMLPPAHRASARDGWTFLTAAVPGDGSQIRRVAGAAGFSYTYLPERAEWAHPAALIFLSTSGTVTRYVYGIEFDAGALRDSIVKAGISEAATAVGFMNRCYHYDPDASSHSYVGVLALRIGAAGFLAVLLSGLAAAHVLRKRRKSSQGAPGWSPRNALCDHGPGQAGIASGSTSEHRSTSALPAGSASRPGAAGTIDIVRWR